MTKEFYTNENALKSQEAALQDDSLTDSAKLMFCRLNCNESFRLGWIVYDSKWTKENCNKFSELEAKGYIFFKDDKVKGVGLIPLEMKPN